MMRQVRRGPRRVLLLLAAITLAAAANDRLDAAAQQLAIAVAARFSGLPPEVLQCLPEDLHHGNRAKVTVIGGTSSGSFDVDLDRRYVTSYFADTRRPTQQRPLFLPGQRPGVVRTASQAEAILSAWLRRLPSFEGIGWAPRVRPTDRAGITWWTASWIVETQGVQLEDCLVDVMIQAGTGGLLCFSARLPPADWRPAQPKLGEDRAVDLARRWCTLEPGFQVTDVSLETWFYLTPEQRSLPPERAVLAELRLFYTVIFDGLTMRASRFGFPGEAEAIRQKVLVDAETGLIDGDVNVVTRASPNTDWQAIARRANPHLATERLRRCLLEDRAPTLARDGSLLWTTSRGGPFERKTSTLALRRPNGPIQLVIRDIPTWAPVFPSISPAGDKLAYSHQGIVHELNLMTGEQRQHTRADRPGSAPVFHPNGLWLAIEAVRSTYDQDVYLVDMARSLTDVDGQRRIIRLDGIEALPAFRTDGRQVVFAHHPPDDPLGPWELWAAELTDTFGEVQNVQRVVGELPEPGGLTWSPDGTWLLWSRQQTPDCELPAWFRIDVEAGTKAELPVPTLPDPELAGRNLVPFDPVLAAPNEVILAAIHWSGKADEAGFWLLYRCRLDGTGLRRLTPRNDVYEEYRFPAGAAEGPAAGAAR